MVGDKVFLRVRPCKSPIRYGKGYKLAPQFVGPFEIMEWIAPVSYRLALPPSISRIHNVFHISVLRKYIPDIAHVFDWKNLQILDGQIMLEPIQIMQSRTMSLRGREIRQVKVLWDPNDETSATWEDTILMRAMHPYLFADF